MGSAAFAKSNRAVGTRLTSSRKVVVLLLPALLLASGYAVVASANALHTSGSVVVGVNPWGVAYVTSNHDLYVANEGSNTVSVLSSSTNNVLANIAVGFSPVALAYDASDQNLYVA